MFTIGKISVPKKSDSVNPIKVGFTIKNTGKREGAEVAQVYAGFRIRPGSLRNV